MKHTKWTVKMIPSIEKIEMIKKNKISLTSSSAALQCALSLDLYSALEFSG